MSGAVADCSVPRLWECTTDRNIRCVNSRGESEPSGLSVYASFDADREGEVPAVYFCSYLGMVSIGIYILPSEARRFAESLMAAADLCDSTQHALNAVAGTSAEV